MLLSFSLSLLLIGAECASLARLRPSVVVAHQYPVSNRNSQAFSQQIRLNHAGPAKKSPVLMHKGTEFDTPGLSTRLNQELVHVNRETLRDSVKLHNEHTDLKDPGTVAIPSFVF